MGLKSVCLVVSGEFPFGGKSRKMTWEVIRRGCDKDMGEP